MGQRPETSIPLKKLTKKCRARFGNHYGPVITGAVALFAVWLFNGLWHGAGANIYDEDGKLLYGTYWTANTAEWQYN